MTTKSEGFLASDSKCISWRLHISAIWSVEVWELSSHLQMHMDTWMHGYWMCSFEYG